MAHKDLETVAHDTGASLAAGLLARARDLPMREQLIKKYRLGTLESIPGQILWNGFREEAAPIFVVYKLIHEALSTTPALFRRSISDFMRAQPDRFASVFNRETIWSVLAHARGLESPVELHSRERIIALLTKANEKGIWRRSDEEIAREADYIFAQLKSKENLSNGFSALRRLQLEKATSLTDGNLMLRVPAKLAQYSAELVSLGSDGRLPKLHEIHTKIDEIVRDNSTEGRHRSVPLDILFTELQEEKLNAIVLARTGASTADREDLRVRLVLVRYFLCYAFKGYRPDQINVQIGFYLDREAGFRNEAQNETLFHREEIITFQDFWTKVTGHPNGAYLIEKVRDSAVESLGKQDLVALIKEHFRRERVSSDKRQNATTLDAIN